MLRLMEDSVRSSQWLLALSFLFISRGLASAQNDTPMPIRTVSQALDSWITITENEVVGAADAMPEGKYSFAPTAGEFTGVRTFAQQVKHLAANNYRMAAYILGRTPTPTEKSETGPDTVQSKAQIIDYLKGSFALLHLAMGAIHEGNMLTPMAAAPSSSQKTRLQLAEDAVAHSFNHYGQMVEYLRMNGIVPPASRESRFACDRLALDPEARKRHFEELGPSLRASKKTVRELSDGYEFQFPSDPKTIAMVAEWAAGERLCCPFLDIQLRLEREGGPFWMRLTGRKGAKDFIKADAAAWVKQ
jgi:DinB superfamily